MLFNGYDGMVTHLSLTAGAAPAGAVRVPSRTWSSSFTVRRLQILRFPDARRWYG